MLDTLRARTNQRVSMQQYPMQPTNSERAYRHELLLECLSRDGWQAVAKTRDLSLQIMVLGNLACNIERKQKIIVVSYLAQ